MRSLHGVEPEGHDELVRHRLGIGFGILVCVKHRQTLTLNTTKEFTLEGHNELQKDLISELFKTDILIIDRQQILPWIFIA